MSKKHLCTLLVLMVFLAMTTVSSADTHYADPVTTPIQTAINAASPGDTVMVPTGRYYEHLYIDKDIILTSTNPIDKDTINNTIIDASLDDNSVVSFAENVSDACLVQGFTIAYGYNSYGGGFYGEGMDNEPPTGPEPRIFACVIIANTATAYGSAIYNCDGLIESCGILQNETLYSSENRGGTIAFCDGMIRSCAVLENEAYGGSGLAYCSADVYGSTFAWNHSTNAGYRAVFVSSSGEMADNIIYFNTGGTYYGNVFYQSNYRIYNSCLQDTSGNGISGNIYTDPLFRNAYYHDTYLASNSPCIGTGSLTALKTALLGFQGYKDLDFHNRPQGTGPDMGSDEYSSQP